MSDVAGEVGDQSGSLGQVVTPFGMVLERCGDSAEPGQRCPIVGGCGFGEAPVEDGGHVSGGAEVPPEGGLVEVDQGMLAGLRGQGDQVSTEGGPGRLVGDPGHDLVGLVVERLDGARSDDVFGGDVQPVGVAEDGLVEPDRGVAEFSELGGGGGGGFVAGQDLFEQLGGGAGRDRFLVG